MVRGGAKYDNVAGSDGLFAQNSGAGPVDLDRSSRFELTASRDQCPSRLLAVVTYTERALLDFWDFAVAGDFFAFLSLCLSALAFAAPLGRSAAETWRGCLRLEVCNVTEVFSPARSRAAKKVLSLASWSGHQPTHSAGR